MKKENLKEKILIALDEIRPFLKEDGGDVGLVSIEKNKIVNIKLLGSCVNCSVNQMTLKLGIETTIQKYAPQIEKVNHIK